MVAYMFSMVIGIIFIVEAESTMTAIKPTMTAMMNESTMAAIKNSFNNTFILNQIYKHEINEKNIENNETDISNMSLEDICKLLGIPLQNCSCNNGNVEMKELCDLHKTNNQTVYNCDNLLNKVIGVSNIISSTLALIGNAFVIWVSLTQHNEFTRFNQLVISLAISDFVFAFVQLIMSVPQTWTCRWVYGLVLCKILRATLAASANIAIGFIVIIAIERYIGVVHLFSSILNKTRFQVMICLNIIFGILSVVPPLKVLKLKEFDSCFEEWSREGSRVYTWLLFLFYYLFPIILMTVLYSVMFVWLRKSFLKSNILNDIAQKSRFIKNKKILFILVWILAMFAILILPNKIFWIINDTYGIYDLNSKRVTRFLTMFSEIPYGFHAAVNPIIYSIVDLRFRQRLKFLLSSAVSALIHSSTLTLSHILYRTNTKIDNNLYHSNIELDNTVYQSNIEADNISYRSHLELDNIVFQPSKKVYNILHQPNIE
ncbi:neuropeptide Y receptor type 4 isoform X1 [Hydra vulgaris]|uniref:Neuropeptide Y receptor type 4 isoform X1 n=1 Tax=Hydra vulgaris TaxID=6087 RepID=A0ABM4CPR5_HYDVU